MTATDTEMPVLNTSTLSGSLLIPAQATSTQMTSLFEKILLSVNQTTTRAIADAAELNTTLLRLTDVITRPSDASPDDAGEFDYVTDALGARGGGFHPTPLSAPEASLVSVTHGQRPLLGDSSDVGALGWIIPVVIVVVLAMVGLAFACYFGVRKLETRMLGWCYRNCACCCAPSGGEEGRLLSGERYATLKEQHGEVGRGGRRREADMKLKDLRESRTTFGGTRSSGKEYIPKRGFNPFDDDED